MGIISFLGQFAFHSFRGRTEKEGDKEFISAFAADLAERIDVGRTLLDINDE